MLYCEMLEKRVVVPETYMMHLKNLEIDYSGDNNGNITGSLMNVTDNGTYTLTPTDFGNAFNAIFSDEFKSYCSLVNDFVNALYEREIKREELMDFISGIRDYTNDDRSAYDIVHEYDVAVTECTTLSEARIEDKNELIDNYGWSTWVAICRLYESLFEVPRENLQ